LHSNLKNIFWYTIIRFTGVYYNKCKECTHPAHLIVDNAVFALRGQGNDRVEGVIVTAI